MKNLTLLLPLLALVACSSSPQQDIEAAIRRHLKDPASATFQNLRVSKYQSYACISWNAKNGFGGYGEWSLARLIHTQSGWQVKDLELKGDETTHCDQDALDFSEKMTSMR